MPSCVLRRPSLTYRRYYFKKENLRHDFEDGQLATKYRESNANSVRCDEGIEPHLLGLETKKREEYRRGRFTRARISFPIFHFSFFIFRLSLFIFHFSKAPASEPDILVDLRKSRSSRVNRSPTRHKFILASTLSTQWLVRARNLWGGHEWIMPNFVRPLKRPIAHTFSVSVCVSARYASTMPEGYIRKWGMIARILFHRER